MQLTSKFLPIKKMLAGAVFLVVLCVLFAGCLDQTQAVQHPVTPPPSRELTTPLIVPAPEAHSVPILMYHHIGDVPADQLTNKVRQDLTVSTANFEAQLKWLRENKYHTITMSDISDFVDPIKAKYEPEKSIVLTFDDGYDDAFTDAVPMLTKYGFTGTFAIITGDVGTPGYLTWDQILTMQKMGMEFVSHTVTHPDLRALATAELKKELVESKRTLEEKLGVSITDIIYPSGKYNADVVRAARDAGYTSGRTTKPGTADRKSSLFELPTIRIHPTTSIKSYEKLIQES